MDFSYDDFWEDVKDAESLKAQVPAYDAENIKALREVYASCFEAATTRHAAANLAGPLVLGNQLVTTFVPEPGTALLIAFGLVGIAVRRRSAAA